MSYALWFSSWLSLGVTGLDLLSETLRLNKHLVMNHLKTLKDIGAIIQNSHIIYTSGKHGSAYVNKDAIYPHTRLTCDLCLEIAAHFEDQGVDVVVAPAIGAVILSQWIAFHLSEIEDREVLSVYAEKDGESFVIKRGYDKLLKDKNCLVVEDILNTGGSALKVVQKVRELGGNVIGVAALCNRGGVTEEDLDDVPELFSLTQIKLEAWDAKDCPLCAKNIPINTSVGKGKSL